MGLKFSREESLPVDIDLKYDLYKASWYEQKYLEKSVNQNLKDKTTLHVDTLEKAGSIIAEFVSTNELPKINILEIMAGNCLASKIIYESIGKKNQKKINSWKATDLQDFSEIIAPLDSTIISVEFNIDCVTAVKNYRTNYNTLLIVSPPPSNTNDNSGYGDYFAIKEWTQLLNAKYIIFIGELGASDGSGGMYKYMMEHNIWKLKVRELLLKTKDVFGGPCEKEIFIFEK
jgi:hypothetical protein